MVRDFKVQVGARNVRPEVTTEYMVEIDNVPVRNEWTRYTGPIDLNAFNLPQIPNPQGKKLIMRVGGTSIHEAVYYLPDRSVTLPPVLIEPAGGMVRDFKVQVGARNVRPEVTTEYMVEIDNVPVRNEWTRYTGPIDLDSFSIPRIPNPQGKKVIVRTQSASGGTSTFEAVYYLPDRSVTLPPVLIEPVGGMIRDFNVHVGARNLSPDVTTEYMVEIDNLPVRNEWTRYTGPIDLDSFSIPRILNPQGKKVIVRTQSVSGGTSTFEAVYYLPDRSVTLPPVLIEPAGGMVRDFNVHVGARNLSPEVTTEYMVEIDNLPVRNEWTRYTGPIDLNAFNLPQIPNPQGKKLIMRVGGTSIHEAVYYLPDRSVTL
eukprot:PhF_6_TR37185/c0_g1_i9/m.54784